MKVLNIFGVVVAIHAAVFMFVFAVPGCRSTPRSASTVPAGGEGTAPSIQYPASDTAMNGAGTSYGSTNNNELNPVGPLVAFNSGSNAGSRFNPTRPDSPVAGVLQSAGGGNVTPASTYTVASNDSLWKISKKHGITINELAAANNLRSNSPLKVGQKLIIPGKTPRQAGASSGEGTGETREYTVRPGDSLGAIARRAGTTVAKIRSLNTTVKGESIRAGQTLLLPAAGAAAATAAVDNPVSATASRVVSGGARHRVMPGESLGQIARLYRVSQKEIAIANNITNPSSLQAGQELVIPGAGDAPQQPAQAAPVEPAPETPVAPAENPVAPAVESSPVSPDAMEQPPVMRVEDGPIAPAPVSP